MADTYILIQGGWSHFTEETYEYYKERYPTIVACIGHAPDHHIRCHTDNPGPGNINYQIVSSCEVTKLRSLGAVDDSIVIKTRSDQRMSHYTIDEIVEFWRENADKHANPVAKRIGVLGVYDQFSFHVQDHLFIGRLKDMELLFTTAVEDPEPFTDEYKNGHKYATILRGNTWLVLNYISSIYPEAEKYVKGWQTYLTEPGNENEPYGEEGKECLEYSRSILKNIFFPLPKISLVWTKTGMYPYDFIESHWKEKYAHTAPEYF